MPKKVPGCRRRPTGQFCRRLRDAYSVVDQGEVKQCKYPKVRCLAAQRAAPWKDQRSKIGDSTRATNCLCGPSAIYRPQSYWLRVLTPLLKMKVGPRLSRLRAWARGHSEGPRCRCPTIRLIFKLAITDSPSGSSRPERASIPWYLSTAPAAGHTRVRSTANPDFRTFS
jgi:hypothetical protein